MECELSVDRQHVLRGLQVHQRYVRKAKRTDQAILGFDGRCLTVEAHGHMFFARAVGSWPGNAYVNAALLAALAKAPPEGDPIQIVYDGKLHFGPITVTCKWQPVSELLISLPKVRDWVQSLAISYSRSRGDIAAAGLTAEVRMAERQLAKLIKRISKSLEPFGVTPTEVRELVERRLEERYTASTKPDDR